MDIRTFEHYFNELYRPLGMYALRLLGDIDEAQDVVQEAFAGVWSKISAGIEIDSFKPYIYRTVHNAAMMRLRGAGTTVSMEVLTPDQVAGLDIESMEPVSDDAMELSERDARLWDAVDRLPERCRRILLMCKRDGMSYREVSEELGISVKTVENQMTKALKTLRETMGHEKASDRSLFMFMI